MTFLTITVTRMRRLGKPSPLPELTEAEARQWFAGWWHGIAVAIVIGFCAGVLVGRYFP